MTDYSKINLQEYFEKLTYDEFKSKKIYGIHMMNTNSALSLEYPHVCIGWSVLGNLDEYTDTAFDNKLNELYGGNKSKIRVNKSIIKIFHKKVNIGDYVCYPDSTTRKLNIGIINSAYKYVPNPNDVYPEQDSDYVNNRDIVWCKDISYDDCIPEIGRWIRTGTSIFSINSNREKISEEIFAILTGKYPDGTKWEPSRQPHIGNCNNQNPNNTEDADNPNDTASDEEEFTSGSVDEENKLKDISFNFPLNVILYGPPGTGKTYKSAEVAMHIVNKGDKHYATREALMTEYKKMVEDGRIVFTTFHQSYGYEDFISGLRPVTDKSASGNLSFKSVDGVFKKIADEAMDDSQNNYVLIIDEINRGNISKIFGELITLLEPDKRLGEVNEIKVHLPVSETGEELFGVPSNLYVIGTMNTADKSISLIDVALRRRFEFFEVVPDENTIGNSTLRKVFKLLNEQLKDNFKSSDLLIGHSYFIDKEEDDIPDIMNRSVIPLLYEYYSDSEDEVRKVVENAIIDCGVEIERGNQYGRIRVKLSENSEPSDMPESTETTKS